ncbi:hypothetical protein Leucomu_05660 [Leucobacter muris]|uniref:HIT-type domain-containing protein n=1 Tax=Leucobacter muris TaxID=1935379 RepID=A0ABX5QEI0_9MICO|nr:hypothetical protein [Leucobacter muris]QAB17474.1 hypothetical protein Leucomu_05660 [Leucobacter muris]
MAKRTCKTCGKRFEGDKRRRYCSAECRSGKAAATAAPPVLRAVEPDEVPEETGPPRPRVLDLETAFEEGTELEQNLALRRHLAALLKTAAPRDAAPLSRQLREIGREIAALEAQELEEAEGAAKTPDEDWDEDAI